MPIKNHEYMKSETRGRDAEALARAKAREAVLAGELVCGRINRNTTIWARPATLAYMKGRLAGTDPIINITR